MEGNSIRGHLLQLVKVQSIVQTLQSRGVMCSCPPVPWHYCKKICVPGSQGVVLCNEYNEARCLSSQAPGFIVWVAADQGVDRRWGRRPPWHHHHHLLHPGAKQNNPGDTGTVGQPPHNILCKHNQATVDLVYLIVILSGFWLKLARPAHLKLNLKKSGETVSDLSGVGPKSTA